MKIPPYSLQEARKIRDEHNHLIGLCYDRESETSVDMVIVTPHDENSMNRFLMLFVMLNDAEAALSMDYCGNQYDVTVVSGTGLASGIDHCSLYKWMAEREGETKVCHHSDADVTSA